MAQPRKTDDAEKSEPLQSEPLRGVTFDLPPDDPRHTDNRGGLDADVGGTAAPAPDHDAHRDAERLNLPDVGGMDDSAAGTTGADLSAVDVQDAAGAASAGGLDGGQPLDLSSTAMAMPDATIGGAGPVEGGRSGVSAPRLEMTDVGLVDVNAVDEGLFSDDEGGGARVEDQDGNPL